MSAVVLSSGQARRRLRDIGGKARGLVAIEGAGAPLPCWFCVLPAWTRAAEADLLQCFDATFSAAARVAVRSSAQDEDSEQRSYAGLLETLLHVPRSRLCEAVESCQRSAASARVLAYRRGHGARGEVRCAVIVQEMIDSRAAGVMFTAHPVTGARGEVIVTAGLGLGEGVVTERVDADAFFVDFETSAVCRREIVHKSGRVTFDARRQEGTTVEAVPPEEADRPALSDDEVAALVSWGRRLAAAAAAPQDVEWAIDRGGRLYVLQTRPITTLEPQRIYDNANIVESYPGLSRPLTFSFARRLYASVFRQSSALFGVPERVLAREREVFENLLAIIGGRIYYDLLNWYRLFQMVPGFEGLLPAWERALGLPPRAVARAGRGALLVRLRIWWRCALLFWRLPHDVDRLLQRVQEVRERHRGADLEPLDRERLLDLHEKISSDLAERFAVTAVNDLFTQQLYDAVGRLLHRWVGQNSAALRNGLFCGETDLDSVRPLHSLLAIVARIRSESALARLFEQSPDAAATWEVVAREHPDLRRSIDEHVRIYGDRMLAELKLETPPMDPRSLITVIRSCLSASADSSRTPARERAIREGAERALERALAGHPLRRALFGWILRGARRGVRYRESLRLARSRAYGVARDIFRAVGDRLARAGRLENAQDVFLLSLEEVASRTADLKAVVTSRQRDYAFFAGLSLPGRIHGSKLLFARLARPSAEDAPPGDVLVGTGCSTGGATAPARVLLDADARCEIRGEILVAPATDPGWVFMMAAASGLVVERGNLLSHTAIIGRELGIPTVIGVAGATRRIADGMRLRVDADAGTVTLLQETDRQ